MRDKDLTKGLDSMFDNYLYFEGYIYSFEKVDDSSLPSRSISNEDLEYNINFEYH